MSPALWMSRIGINKRNPQWIVFSCLIWFI
jgi:hypothetical protein